MPGFSPVTVSPIILERTRTAQTYSLVALAMFLTLLGVFVGGTFALPIISSGWIFLLFVVELVIVFSARVWVSQYPLNYMLFALFPVVSGITVTPFLMSVLAGYANGSAILINAAIATTLLTLSAALLAYAGPWDMGAIGSFLFYSLIGLIVFGLLQVFVPSLRTGQVELLASGFGIVVFSLFITYDVQRLKRMSAVGASPFILALHLYLDIFNLFLYVVRFMIAMSGRRR